MKYKVAVCDDSKTDREYVSCMVENWANQRAKKGKMKDFLLRLSLFPHSSLKMTLVLSKRQTNIGQKPIKKNSENRKSGQKHELKTVKR